LAITGLSQCSNRVLGLRFTIMACHHLNCRWTSGTNSSSAESTSAGPCLTIAEADGVGKYADTGRAVKQLERDQLLREAGFKVVHFTWRQLFRETDRLIARIKEVFALPGPL